MKIIHLKPNKQRSLLRAHPWIFSGAIHKGRADAGETVAVHAHDDSFLAWGAYSPASQIRVRVWSFAQSQHIDQDFFVETLARALKLRQRMPINSNAQRLIHAESDGLPGLIVDRYDDTLVAQFGSAGVERWKDTIADALLELTGCTRLYERSDTQSRQREALPMQTGWLRGGGECALQIQEHNWRFALDVARGHKTGYYLDQRDNRQACYEHIQRLGCDEVLNCYSYTGGFTVAALAAGAKRVISVDSSAPALDLARANVQLNGYDACRAEFICADVNSTLRQAIEDRRQFDAIILDPPKLAPTAAHAQRAARAYKDINRLAFKLLKPGGMLFTFSCSGGISAELFQKIVASAAVDAKVDGIIVNRLQGACDHPMALPFPEGEYLKGLLVMRAL